MWHIKNKLHREKRLIEGVVEERWVVNNSRRPTFVRYSFTLPGDPKKYGGTDQVPEDWFDTLPLGGVVTILFLPSNPKISETDLSYPAPIYGEEVLTGAAISFLLAVIIWAVFYGVTCAPRESPSDPAVSPRA